LNGYWKQWTFPGIWTGRSTHKQWQVANYNERGTCSTRPGDRVIQHCKWQTMQCYVTYSLRYCTYIIEADHAHSYNVIQHCKQTMHSVTSPYPHLTACATGIYIIEADHAHSYVTLQPRYRYIHNRSRSCTQLRHLTACATGIYIIEADHAHSYVTLQPVLQVYT
jgi:hypothetical protein